jgi:hypothetical protein
VRVVPRTAVAGRLHLSGPMTLYRSLVIGLLGACLYLVASRHDAPAPHVAVTRPVVHQPPTVVDVSSQMDPSQLVSLVRIGAGEHIASVEQHPGWVDVGVEGLRGERRVLLLLH